jgi:hypothetical protein
MLHINGVAQSAANYAEFRVTESNINSAEFREFFLYGKFRICLTLSEYTYVFKFGSLYFCLTMQLMPVSMFVYTFSPFLICVRLCVRVLLQGNVHVHHCS